MKPVREVVSRDVIEDLWGAGYTILPRNRHPDPFFVPPELVPSTRSYQWWHLVHDRGFFGGNSGWSPVPASRHDGYFMPAGHVGDIEVSGLGLFEKPKFEVDEERARSHAKAHKNVSDWIKETGGTFSGSVSVDGVETAIGASDLAARLFPKTKTIETMTSLPPDMIPHMRDVFDERDRLYNELIAAWNDGEGEITEKQRSVITAYCEAVEADPNILKGPTLNALLMPQAIENVRAKLGEPPLHRKMRETMKKSKTEKPNE